MRVAGLIDASLRATTLTRTAFCEKVLARGGAEKQPLYARFMRARLFHFCGGAIRREARGECAALPKCEPKCKSKCKSKCKPNAGVMSARLERDWSAIGARKFWRQRYRRCKRLKMLENFRGAKVRER